MPVRHGRIVSRSSAAIHTRICGLRHGRRARFVRQSAGHGHTADGGDVRVARHLLPVALCVFVAMFISDLLKVKPIYETLLERFMGGSPLTEEEKGSLFELPVEIGSCIAHKSIKNVEMPAGCLIVGIRRGTKDLVPRGNTKILPGDYLLILCGSDDSDNVRESMRKLCHLN
jgi:hypothetical protein